MNDPNEKKVALVTGASRGIGKELVEELIHQGWYVAGIARSEERLQNLKDKFSDHFLGLTCDVSCREAVKSASQELISTGWIPSLFFLNAGIAGDAACESIERFDVEKHRELFDTNYFGVLNWVEEWLPVCQNSNSTIFVATSSINAIFAPPTGSAYAASKAAIAKAFEGLSLTYHSSKNLHFLVVYPGPVKTEGLKGKVPFIWEPARMAKYMIKNSLKKKSHMENSLFYAIFSRMLRILPAGLVMRILGQCR
ncbi:SDR family NAD(P)-dependent oxidoreductase [Simkania negevensis]|uniref:SDR family NAD(P)-dependent oxidoreductase n=1 Tax=Simkania negevensis TaxID=83561 RepID=A0ABS3AUB4_9BACT|nr:SDR family NAD(P)-dependent oxidoreductase [Simkania negevensis]